MKKQILSFFAVCVSMVVIAANYEIGDLSVLDSGFYFEGDTLTLPAGSYTVMGDAIATVADNVVTCKKSGFTLLNDGSADHRLCVVPQPPAGGDVFYWKNTDGNGQNWSLSTRRRLRRTRTAPIRTTRTISRLSKAAATGRRCSSMMRFPSTAMSSALRARLSAATVGCNLRRRTDRH